MAIDQDHEPLMAMHCLPQAHFLDSMAEKSKRLEHHQCHWANLVVAQPLQGSLSHPVKQAVKEFSQPSVKNNLLLHP